MTAGLGGVAAEEAAGLVPHLTTRRSPLLLPRVAWRVRRLSRSGLSRAQTTSRGVCSGSLGCRYYCCGPMLALAPTTPLSGGRGARGWSLAPLRSLVGTGELSVPGVTLVLCAVATSSSAWALDLGRLRAALTDLLGVAQCAGEEDEAGPAGDGSGGGGGAGANPPPPPPPPSS